MARIGINKYKKEMIYDRHCVPPACSFFKTPKNK